MPHSESILLLRKQLSELIKRKGSDLHIKSNASVRARVNEEIIILDETPLSQESIKQIIKELAADHHADFIKNQELDMLYIFDENYRFRVNIYVHLTGYALVFRLIPKVIKTAEELNLPNAIHKLSKLKRGLVLITGTTGSGKSTTLASIIEEINCNKPRHIITIEDPIEYVYHDKKSIIEQRSIGRHTKSFALALRSAMREDPDIIIVGELRDIETAENVLHAANTGQLVFTTLHTTDARETIDRLIAMFPTKEQNRVRMNLAVNIQAIVSQRLLKSVDDELLPAVEIMFTSPRIRHMIQMQADADIPDAMAEEETSYGSITFNKALFTLLLEGKITEDIAFNYATSSSDLKLLLTTSQEYQHMKESNIPDEIHIKGEEERIKAEEAMRKHEEEKLEALKKLRS